MKGKIFHITSREAWNTAQAQGQYSAPSLTNEGFIHCSTRAQVIPVAEKFYKGQSRLILLAIDPARLSSDLKWEAPFDGAPPPGVPAGDAFPHIYGPINLDSVIEVLDLNTSVDGKFVLPSNI